MRATSSPRSSALLTRRRFLARAVATSLAPGAAAAAAAVLAPVAALGAGRTDAHALPAANESPLRPTLLAARSWGYQLQAFDLRALMASPVDVLVVDYSITGADSGRLSEATLKRLKRKPDGSRRIVLAYMSIGEAEEYRYYWRRDWIESEMTGGANGAAAAPEMAAEKPAAPAAGTGTGIRTGAGISTGAGTGTNAKPPALPPAKHETTRTPAESSRPKRVLSASAPPWLGDENESWSGNFAVKYWDPGWQSLIVGGPGCYLDRIIAAGFDGVYLDRVDAYYEFENERHDPAADMTAFVARIATEARARVPGFLVVPQNAEELLTHPAYVATIDAIAKEDLLYGSATDGEANSPAQVAHSVAWLSYARRGDRPVFVIEYLDAPAEIAKARGELKRLGYIGTFGPRMLDQLSPEAVGPTSEPHP